jgi:hypothetical protein
VGALDHAGAVVAGVEHDDRPAVAPIQVAAGQPGGAAADDDRVDLEGAGGQAHTASSRPRAATASSSSVL